MVPANCSSITLRKVTDSDSDIQMLFELLKQRQFGISHVGTLSFEQHREFVLSHPYRAWYFVQELDACIGSVYLLDSNHIGINMLAGKAHGIEPAIALLRDLYEPLPPIASVRSAGYV